MPKDDKRKKRDEKGTPGVLDAVVNFIKTNTGLSGEASRDLGSRREKIEKNTRTKTKTRKRKKR